MSKKTTDIEKKLKSEGTDIDTLAAKLDALTSSFKTAKSLSFEYEGENQLRVTMETERLRLASCIDSDDTRKYYTALLSDPKVMEKNGYGGPNAPWTITTDIEDYSSRWNHNNPFSALSIFEKDTDDDETQQPFVGTVILKESSHSKKPGTAILSFYINQKYWSTSFKQMKPKEEDLKTKKEWKGIGTEAVSAVVQDYAPALKKHDYKLKQKQFATVDQSFDSINATARKDNIGSCIILERVGMTCTGEKEMFGNGLRKCYTKKV